MPIDQLIEMYGLEWIDYVEYLDQEDTQCDS